MKQIVQLSQSLINKIAAGEVVERPLSVVKELTENAIDAGATMVTVEILDGGLTMVRVTDNGGGISPENLPLAFARHATSKIASFDDLMQVQTLGFRGEALSSISAVSHVEMITKTREMIAGTRIEVHGGKVISTRDIGCADGTTIKVSNLFYNTPARRKFLKKPATEAGYISHCLERLALGNPALILRYINNGQVVFQTIGNGDLKTAMLNVYGRETAVKTATVNATTDTDAGEMCLSGLIGKPEIARGNRRHGSFFINGRYIESNLITRAIEAAMKTMLPSGKFPIYALSLTLPPESLDVNVHPTKMDVRFADENGVFAFIEDAVRDALEEHNLIPTARFGSRTEPRTQEPEAEQIPLPFERKSISSGRPPLARLPFEQTHPHSPQERPPFERERTSRPKWNDNRPFPAVSPSTEASDEPSSPRTLREDSDRTNKAPEIEPQPTRFFTHYQIHGLIFQTYWLVAQGESLYMIDQHAAHERVLYENILRKAQEESVHAQSLLMPIALRLTPRERQILHDNRKIFASFGFEISDNTETIELLTVPFLMKGPIPTGFFTDLLDKMDDVGFSEKSVYNHKTEIIAMAACKAAVKAGDTLNETEAHALIEQLLELDNPFTCPHGRPTIIEMPKTEIERRFKR
ncbi:MAG: DNA mismatch repair endonuclease MutL [Defluviitaleaceae bacterium]|nr:DNA mismatch repair endonuclease MutL [Defluviitaleaceae bacterium]